LYDMQAARAGYPAGIGRVVWRTIRLAAGAALLALVAFHVWLFWDHFVAGRLTDPLTAGKWTASALLVLGLMALHRRGVPLISSRRAVVLWTLAAFIHVGAMSRVPPDAQATGVAHGLILVVPGTVGALLTVAMMVMVAAGSRRHAAAPRGRRIQLARACRCRPVLTLTGPGALRAPPLGIA
jgi:hypothetical protein